MKAYVCTYLHGNAAPVDRNRTLAAAERDPILRVLVDGWNDSYYDWGDDPSFFSAQENGVPEKTWGVCRPDVRESLDQGDIVIFFCARQRAEESAWDYHLVGFGKVRELVVNRASLWQDNTYAPYRTFYNTLVAPSKGGHLVHHETIHPYHKDWQRRARAPYVIFDGASSSFNLASPHCVATWERRTTVPERWRKDERSREIEALLFRERKITRRLRTSIRLAPHPKLNLSTDSHGRPRPGSSLSELVRTLRRLI